MNRRDLLKGMTVGLAAMALPAWLEQALCADTAATVPGAASADRPNIICILVDDVGLGNIGCYGGAFKTPRIDALAREGARFERCFATPLCGPTRCQLLTGQYPFRTGLVSNQSADAISPKKQIMIPTVLKAAGYKTVSVGKWGQMCLGPGEWGFDENLVYAGSGKFWASQGPYRVNGKEKTLKADEYLPDVMHEFLVDFIERQKDGRFFAYYSMSHMHGPILRTPESKDQSGLYADNVAYMDKLVGRLVDALDRLKLREKTLILFVGDNGTAPFNGAPAMATVNGKALSGAKGSMWEGGSRVPMIVNWPGKTPAGKVLPDLLDVSDLLPTFAELGGAALPKDRTFDGRSFAPQILGQAGNPREWVYVELAGRRYVREDRWKLTGAGDLYDMKNAPFSEALILDGQGDDAAEAARKRLHAVLVGLVGQAALGGEKGMDKPAKPPKANPQRAARRAARKARQGGAGAGRTGQP